MEAKTKRTPLMLSFTLYPSYTDTAVSEREQHNDEQRWSYWVYEIGCDIEDTNEAQAMRPLHIAASQNNIRAVRWLLMEGADPEVWSRTKLPMMSFPDPPIQTTAQKTEKIRAFAQTLEYCKKFFGSVTAVLEGLVVSGHLLTPFISIIMDCTVSSAFKQRYGPKHPFTAAEMASFDERHSAAWDRNASIPDPPPFEVMTSSRAPLNSPAFRRINKELVDLSK